MKRLSIIILVLVLILSTACSISTPKEEPNNNDKEENTEPEPEDDPWNQIPDSPTNLITTLVTHDTIEISWDVVSNALRYKVVFSEDGGNEQEFVVEETSFGMTLLNSQTLYKFKVYSGNLQGWSWWYSTLWVQTTTVYGDVYFYTQLFNRSNYSFKIYIDGYLVDSWSQGQGRTDSTIPTLTGWRLFELEYRYQVEDWYYNYIWFYLTPSGISIRKRYDELDIQ